MKLRINGDSLRLRVSRSELARFISGERVEETIRFTASPDARLTYALEPARQSAPVSIGYEPQCVSVSVSEEQAQTWAREDEVGIYASLSTGDGRSLKVIIEKDFACLDRGDEENTDTFANPQAGVMC